MKVWGVFATNTCCCDYELKGLYSTEDRAITGVVDIEEARQSSASYTRTPSYEIDDWEIDA